MIGAVLSTLDARPSLLATIDLHVHYLEAVHESDMVAQARVRQKGKSVVFVEVEVNTTDGREVAHGEVSLLLRE